MARRKKRVNIPAIILTLITLLIMGGCVFIYLFGNQTMLQGEWQREIDITDYAVDAITEYLGQTLSEKQEVWSEDTPLTVKVSLKITKEGEWIQTVDEASYNEALARAKNVLTDKVSDSLKQKIDEAYIKTDKSVDELINEATGMELSKYLEEYGPKLLPSIGELSEMYGVSATYEATRDSISRNNAGEESVFGYVVTQDILVIDKTEETAIYHKTEETNTEHQDKEAEDE